MPRLLLLGRAALAAGVGLALAVPTFLLLAPAEEAPSLASEAGGPAAAWSPAPLLALLLVASMSGLVLLVTMQPRRG